MKYYPPSISDEKRLLLDETEEILELEKLKKSYVSPMNKNTVILNMFGIDDFYTVERYFHEAKVPNIYHFSYSEKSQLKRNISYIQESFFSESLPQENIVYNV